MEQRDTPHLKLGNLIKSTLLTGLFVLAGLASAQTVSTYTFTQASGTYTSITGGTQLWDEGDNFDDGTPVAVTIPAFWFAGAYHTTMYVTTNGFITFGSAPSSTEFTPLSSSDGYAGAISAFGADIEDANNGNNTEVRWQNTGGDIVVQWRDVERVINGNDEIFSCQIRMNTTTGVVRLIYSSVTNVENSTSKQPQVGLRGPNNTFATNVKNRLVNTTAGSNTWATSTNGTSNTSTCRFTSGTTPNSGQTYTFTPPCTPPTMPAAGADQTICLAPGSATMAANAPAVGSGSWSQVGGTSATITTLSSPTTTITGMTTAGTRTFRWTITNGTCTASDDVVITTNGLPTVANAGPDQNICAASGTATLAGNAAVTGTDNWSFVSGPVTPSITNSGSPGATISGMTTAGVYTFRWTITNSPCPASSDDMVITSTAAPTTANAGPDQAICITTPSVTLAANAPAVGTGAWSMVSGPSTSNAQFSNVSVHNTTFTPAGGAGTYTLRWTTTNAPCSNSTDNVVITVSGTPTVANAGPDQTGCTSPGTATLAGNAASTGTDSWSFVSGPVTPTITNSGSPAASVSGMTAPGTYTFRWTIANSPCPASQDDMAIVVGQNPSATASVVPSCGTNTYSINVNVTSIGSAGSVTIQSPSGTDVISNVGTGSYVINNIPFGTARTVTIVPNGGTTCGLSLGSFNYVDADQVCHAAATYPIVDNGCGSNTYTNVPFCVSTAGTSLGTDVFIRSVDLIASHAYNADLEISLISPSGTTVSLIADRFGNGANLGNPGSCPGGLLTLQDGGTALTTTNTSNVTGTYAPEQPLTTFHNGSNPTGTWTLRACDDANADLGAIRYVRLNLCLPPQATFTAVDDCAGGQFSVQVNVTSLGTAPNANLAYTVNGVAFSQTGIGAGITTIGPFLVGSEVICTVSSSLSNCGSVQGAVYSNCPYVIPCGNTITVDHCYRNNDSRTFTFVSGSAFETVTVTFIAGTMDPQDVIRAYDGTDNTGTSIPTLTGTFANLANVTGTSMGNSLYIEIDSDGSNSCSTGQQSSWSIEAKCTPGCVDPDGAVTVNTNCAAYNFNLDVEVFFTGDAATTTLRYKVNGGAPVDIPGLVDYDVVNIGPFAIDDVVNVKLLHENSASCDKNLGNFTDNNSCPSGENCVNALNLATQTSPLPGSTTSRTNDFSFACGTATANTARDAIYYIDVPNGAQLNIRQQSNNYNSQHYVRYGGACPGTTVIACVDDDAGETGWVNWSNTTGSTKRVWWIQDGFGTASGNFVLEWQLVTCPVAPGPPTGVTTSYSICQNGTVPAGQGLNVSCGNVAQTSTNTFPGGGLISEGTTLTTRATVVVPALPAGAVVTAARLKLTNVVANTGFFGQNAQRQNIRVALAGSYTLAETQLTTATGPGTVTPNPMVINLPGFPVAGGSIDFRTRQTSDQTWTNPDVNIGGASIEVDYVVPTSVRWYNAPITGTLVFTGALFNPIAAGVVNSSTPGTSNFYATCAYGSCENIRIPTSFTVVQAANAGTNGTLTICSTASPVSLFAQLGGSPQAGGTWSGPSAVSGGMYNPATMNPGIYTYTVTGNAPCSNASRTVTVTENAATLWYADADGDGFGDPGSSQLACTAPLNHVANNTDQCPADGAKQVPGVCGCGVADTDSDNDGTANCNDGCPNDPNKIAPGVCGCGVADVMTTYYADLDGDGFGDATSPLAGYTCNTPSGYVTNTGDACPSDPNKQAPGACGCGVADTDSDNDGTANCNDGCPNDPNKIAPGICGCGVADTDSDNDGTANCNDGCPNDPNKIAPGICGCGVTDADTDNDGTADCNDGCPSDPNKTAPGACGCGVADVTTTYYADTDNDGFGDPTSALAGYTCNTPSGYVTNTGDACPSDPNKQAPGACGCGVVDVPITCFVDADGDGAGDPNSPVAAYTCNIPSGHVTNGNDGCPNDPNKSAPGICGCGVPDTDTDSDGLANCVDPCPLLPGVQNGDICDANPGPGYTLGTITNCSCQPVACSNMLNLELQTDGISNITWELRQQGTNTLVQSGGGIYPPTPSYGENTCLPDGCFYLRVLDDGGDGIIGGGYILRSQGKRIIDNRNNFTNGFLSQIANNEGFCLPMGTDRLIFVSCDRLDWTSGEYIVANDDPAVAAQWQIGDQTDDGYEMWFYNPNGGYSFRRFHSHAVSDGFSPANASRACHIKINNWSAANALQNNVLYNVRVRGRVNGTNSEWGQTCRFKLDPVRAQCPLTKLMDIPGNQYLSCGASRPLGPNSLVHARPVTKVNANGVSISANKYQFRFRIVAENFSVTKTSATGQYWVPVTSPLQPCKTYEVDVRASFDNGATWCTDFVAPALTDPWGDVCLLTVTCAMQGGGQNLLMEEPSSSLKMYPNPNRGDQLMLGLEEIEEGVKTVSVDIYDTFGAKVMARTVAVQDGFVNTVLPLDGQLASGMYVVNITAGERNFTERLVIQP